MTSIQAFGMVVFLVICAGAGLVSLVLIGKEVVLAIATRDLSEISPEAISQTFLLVTLAALAAMM